MMARKKSKPAFDLWTIPHALSGVGLGLMKVKPITMFGVLIGYEILENLILRKESGMLFKEDELLSNAVADVIVGATAYYITRDLSNKKVFAFNAKARLGSISPSPIRLSPTDPLVGSVFPRVDYKLYPVRSYKR